VCPLLVNGSNLNKIFDWNQIKSLFFPQKGGVSACPVDRGGMVDHSKSVKVILYSGSETPIFQSIEARFNNIKISFP